MTPRRFAVFKNSHGTDQLLSLLTIFACLTGLVVLSSGACQASAAAADYAGERSTTTRKEHEDLGPGERLQEYDEIISPEMESASSLANRARIALKNGNVSRALALSKRALKKNDDDIDIRMILAESMEAKLEREPDKDPELYKSCVHEWLIVYRGEVGEEKGMTYKGLNIVGTWWNDDNRGGVAKKHLKKLVGYVPKAWETDNRFMAKVVKPAEATVSGRVSNKVSDKANDKADAKPDGRD